MKKLWATLLVLISVSAVNAAIIDWNCADDGDGAIVMTNPTRNYDSGTGEYSLAVNCVQDWYPGHIEGEFITDTELDPTVWFMQTIDNDTDFAWTDYHITITMNKSFTLSNASGPDDWTAIITAPVQSGSQWIGSVDYYAGTPIQIGESGDFGFKMSFLGSVQFCTEQYPTPEPATVAILALGALALRKRK